MSGVRVSQPVQYKIRDEKFILSVDEGSLSTRANTNIIMAGIVNYIKESFEELKNNVSWPTWAETQSLTILVAVFSIIFSLAIWGVDTVFSKVIGYYFNLING